MLIKMTEPKRLNRLADCRFCAAVLCAVLLIVLNIVLYFIDFPAATVMSVFMVFLYCHLFIYAAGIKTGHYADIIAFHRIIHRCSGFYMSWVLPYCLLDANGK